MQTAGQHRPNTVRPCDSLRVRRQRVVCPEINSLINRQRSMAASALPHLFCKSKDNDRVSGKTIVGSISDGCWHCGHLDATDNPNTVPALTFPLFRLKSVLTCKLPKKVTYRNDRQSVRINFRNISLPPILRCHCRHVQFSPPPNGFYQ